MEKLIRFLAVFTAFTVLAFAEPFVPSGIFLTWQHDPTTTMTIDWHSIDGEDGEIELVKSEAQHQIPITIPVVAKVRTAVLEYRALGAGAWIKATGKSEPYPFVEERMQGLHRDGYSQPFAPQGRTIHRVELIGLKPDALYEFRFDAEGRVDRFRTLPKALTREVRIAMGGDVGYGVWTERMNRLAASYDPDFAVWGGDLAYDDGERQRLGRWYGFFDSLTKSFVTKDGRRIPVLLTTGNHETTGGYYASAKITALLKGPYVQDDATRRKIAPYFFSFFAFPGQPGYNVMDVGNYLSVVLLDSGHNNPQDGAQAAWLDQTLGARAKLPYVFPVYHVPAFPSLRSQTDPSVVGGRRNWVPLFEKHHLPVVFENHDHNYKRTYPIKDGKKDPQNGTVYLGDGSWGVLVSGVAEDAAEKRWYLEKAEPLNHFILARLTGAGAQFEAISLKGDTIDRYSVKPR